MGSREKRAWPERFPVGRALIAFLVIPPFTALVGWIVAMLNQPNGRSTRDVLMLPLLAMLYSWPGYAVFLVLGFPTLYALYRLKWTGFAIFALIGAVYTFLPCPVAGLTVRPFVRRNYVEFVKAEFPFLGPIGAINGLLTRLIVLGRRSTSRPSRELL